MRKTWLVPLLIGGLLLFAAANCALFGGQAAEPAPTEGPPVQEAPPDEPPSEEPPPEEPPPEEPPPDVCLLYVREEQVPIRDCDDPGAPIRGELGPGPGSEVVFRNAPDPSWWLVTGEAGEGWVQNDDRVIVEGPCHELPIESCGGEPVAGGLIEPALCGDNFCDPGLNENPDTCPADCAGAPGLPQQPPPAPKGAVCGNGTCESGEDPCSCPGDCTWATCAELTLPICGDGTCNDAFGEDPCSCPNDCTWATCAEITLPICGDGTCNGGEDPCSCPNDCTWATCAEITLPICGDGVCNTGEDPCSCPGDCTWATCADVVLPIGP